MATSSITGAERAPLQPSGRGTDRLGPSDSSDSGSDVQNERGFDALDDGEIGGERADLASDTDATGTGEHAAAVHDTDIVEGADIAPDRIDSIDATDDGDISAAATRQSIDALAADNDGDADIEDEAEDERSPASAAGPARSAADAGRR